VLLWRQSAAIHMNAFGHVLTFPKIAWTWYVFLGSMVTFAVGYVLSLMGNRDRVA
jgi:ABC-type uncharacterized transport system fused permease/ATPase subunit